MAEGFEPYHVPQQSRRDKLRIVVQNHPSSSSPLCVDDSSASAGPLHTFYDTADLLFHHQQQQLKATSSVCVVKEEGVNNNLMMGFDGASTTSHHHHHHPYLDPHLTLQNLNPNSTILDINNNCNNPFLYTTTTPHNLHQNFRDFDDQSYSGGGGGGGSDVVLFRPEPLSLSLSSHHNSLPVDELNPERYGSAIYGDHRVITSSGYLVPTTTTTTVAGTSNEVSRSSNSSLPFGPFTGYASILKGSRFLKPAQQLMEEFCDVGLEVFAEKITSVDATATSMDPPPYPLVNLNSSCGIMVDDDSRRQKSRLISMLDEVYRRYKQYYQQMQAVVASFEYVAGLGNAAPFANLALKAMCKHFRSLKNAIADQLQYTNKSQIHVNHGKEEASTFGNTDRRPYSQTPVHSQPVWRPQRGLPERAVTVLRAWLFEHFLHPYPTDTEKLMLAKQTGLSRSQVSNWFINARVRLWKPMVEEIHTLETRQAQKAPQREERSANRSDDDHLPSATSHPSEKPSASTQRVQDTPSKRCRNEFPDIPLRSEPPPNFSYNFSNHPPVGVSMEGASSNVSLTLGLYQNNGIGLSESYPMNAAQRFGLGLEASSEGGFVLGGYEAQSRIFGRDVIGGQLLHDFVG